MIRPRSHDPAGARSVTPGIRQDSVTGRAAGQADAVAVPEPAGADADGLRAYRIALAREARHHHHYPALARERGWTGTADIELEVSEQGQVRPPRLVRSSGHDILDHEALTLMVRAASAVVLPASLHGQAFSVRLSVEFQLSPALPQ